MKDRNTFDQVLDACLDHVLREGQSVEWCIQRHPEQASELEPLLRLALASGRGLAFVPTASAKAEARRALHAAMAKRRGRWGDWAAGWREIVGSLSWRARVPQWAAAVVGVLVVAVLGSTSMVAASSTSMPDQPLYPVKRAVESARLAVTWDDKERSRLLASYASQRVKEMAFAGRKGNMQRLRKLEGDLDRHLQEMEASTYRLAELPEGAFPRPSTTVTRAIPGPPLPEGARALARQRAEELRGVLQQRQRNQELVWQEALRDAPPPAQEALEQARQREQMRYRAVLLVLQSVTAGEGPGPVAP